MANSCTSKLVHLMWTWVERWGWPTSARNPKTNGSLVEDLTIGFFDLDEYKRNTYLKKLLFYGDLTIEFGDLTIESRASKLVCFVVGILDECWIHHKSDESHPSKLGGKNC